MFVDLPLLKLENSIFFVIMVKEVSQLFVDGVRTVEWYLKTFEIGVLVPLVILLPFNVVVEIGSEDGVGRTQVPPGRPINPGVVHVEQVRPLTRKILLYMRISKHFSMLISY